MTRGKGIARYRGIVVVGNGVMQDIDIQRILQRDTATGQGRKGTSSVCYRVEVFGEKEARSDKTALFTTQITFVNLDESGGKAPIQ